MTHILESIYNLLCWLTEDARAHGFTKSLPEPIMKAAEELCTHIEEYLENN